MMEQAAREVLARLEQRGYAAYEVGGCVRDRLLKLPLSDIDIATSATPEETMEIFPKVIPTGIKHGTVTVLWGEHAFEVTTFRIDGDYQNHRQPNKVEFVDKIELDLARRDFTINAMAMDRRGNLIDPFEGKADLERGLLRAVGEPRTRFVEDALRLLRALRFSARFRFSIEPKTWDALLESAPLLVSISKERIRDELAKMIGGNNPEQALKLLSTPSLLPFSDLSSLFSERTGSGLPPRFSELTERGRWVGLFLFAEWEEEKSARFLRKWKFSKRETRDMIQLLKLTPAVSSVDIKQSKRLLLRHGFEFILEALRIMLWIKERALDETSLDLDMWRQLDAEIEIRDLSELAVGGKELLVFFNRKPGPWIGSILHTLFEQVALGELPNERDRLLEAARKVLNEIEGTNTEHL